MKIVKLVFGGVGQITVGTLTFIGANFAWIYGSTLHGEKLIVFIFHASMAALDVAAYSIIAAALAIKTAERVEEQIGD